MMWKFQLIQANLIQMTLSLIIYTWTWMESFTLAVTLRTSNGKYIALILSRFLPKYIIRIALDLTNM